MPPSPDAPIDWFVDSLDAERIWGQVRVLRRGEGWELRHVGDAATGDEDLRSVETRDLRDLAERDAAGGFRPLKAAPSLVRGWRWEGAGSRALAEALDALYPGSIADAWALAVGMAEPVAFRDHVTRLGGRAGRLTSLEGLPLEAAIEGCCGHGLCLKDRLWSAPGVPAEVGRRMGAMPCLEPCAVFLALARACAGMEQSSSVPVTLAPGELATVVAALRHAVEHPPAGLRDGEVSDPLHPRRIARLLRRRADTWASAAAPEATESNES